MFADKSDPELLLLKYGDHSDEFDITAKANRALKTAPIITGDAFATHGSNGISTESPIRQHTRN